MERIIVVKVCAESEELERLMLDSIDGAACGICEAGRMGEDGTKPRSWTCDKCGYNLKYFKAAKHEKQS